MALIAQVHAGRTRRASNLTGVKLLGRKKDNQHADSAASEEDAQAGPDRTGTTAPKGKPTPKRSQAAR